MSKIKFLFNHLGIVFGLLAILSVVVYAQSSWNAPTANPPGDNTAAPVNVGASNQVKVGGLGVGPLAVFGNALVNGDLNVTGVYKSNGKSGIQKACPAGQSLSGVEVSGGIVTAGSCAAGGAGGGGGAGAYQGYFGGMYSYTWHGPNCTGGIYGASPNLVTGGYSCPAGFTVGSVCYYGASGVPSMTVYYCIK
jgi:hypothetical protein